MRSITSILSVSYAASCLFSGTSAGELKDVFAHYMVGGMDNSSRATTDVADAQALGLNAFALNVQDVSDSWSTQSIEWLFEAANTNGNFKLFFSFDMSVLDTPSQFLSLLEKYVDNDAYYTFNSLPFVSTFHGGALSFSESSPNEGWTSEFKDVLASAGITPFFAPDFDDYAESGEYDADFFDTFTVVDGVLSWDSAWPWESDGLANVTSTKDEIALTNAHAANKVYIMPLSTLQFKHLEGSNWYRRGELNLAQRIVQVLDLQPDFVEVITWNDAGESHYIGNLWTEAIGDDQSAYTDGYSHTAWQNIIGPFITAYKNGATNVSAIVPATGDFSGAMWYSPLLVNATCPSDPLGPPSNVESMQDTINVVVLLPSNTSGVTIEVYSGGSQIGSWAGVEGLNSFSVPGVVVGAQSVRLMSSTGAVIGSASSTIDVAATTTGLCNFNYQVIGIY